MTDPLNTPPTSMDGCDPQASSPIAARLDRAFRLYRRRIDRCRTENQLARVHIALENYLTPAEVRHFTAAVAEDPPEAPSRRWLDWLAGQMPINKARPAEFERRGLLKSATRYTADAGSTGQKTLLIGFAGHFHRLMSPTPWLLDCLNPALFDVIVLRDFARQSFMAGIPGLGGDLLGAMTRLATVVDVHAYRNAIAFGTSGGGTPALLAAIQLRLNRGISVCGQDFDHAAARLRSLGVSSDAYAELLSLRPQPFPELIVVCGADFPEDASAAERMHDRIPSRLWKVRGCAQHAVLIWHLQRGTLPAFLAKLLGQSLEHRELGPTAITSAEAMR